MHASYDCYATVTSVLYSSFNFSVAFDKPELRYFIDSSIIKQSRPGSYKIQIKSKLVHKRYSSIAVCLSTQLNHRIALHQKNANNKDIMIHDILFSVSPITCGVLPR